MTFHRLGEGRTRVTLPLDVDPEGPIENAGDAIGIVKLQVRGDVKRFKEFIESRGQETGAWRGEVDQKAN